MPCCPDCHAQVVDKDGVPLLQRNLVRRKRSCGECGSPLLAGRPLRAEALPARRVREAPDEGLLRAADRRRDPRVQGARIGPRDRGRTSGECRQARLADANVGSLAQGQARPTRVDLEGGEGGERRLINHGGKHRDVAAALVGSAGDEVDSKLVAGEAQDVRAK